MQLDMETERATGFRKTAKVTARELFHNRRQNQHATRQLVDHHQSSSKAPKNGKTDVEVEDAEQDVEDNDNHKKTKGMRRQLDHHQSSSKAPKNGITDVEVEDAEVDVEDVEEAPKSDKIPKNKGPRKMEEVLYADVTFEVVDLEITSLSSGH